MDMNMHMNMYMLCVDAHSPPIQQPVAHSCTRILPSYHPTRHPAHAGSRWSLALYSIMGVHDLVAEDEQDYVRLAVRVATDVRWADDVRARIRERSHRLFESMEAVHAWEELLSRLAREGVAEAWADGTTRTM